MSETSNEILQQLLSEIGENPGASVFPNLAEAYRRVGQAERAREIATRGLEHAPERMAGRVALGLALLDVGEDDEAREVLSVILEDVPELMALLQPKSPEEERREPVDDAEIDQAFTEAEAQPDEMLDVNDVAEAALRQERLDEPEVAFAPSEHPAFATETMANLLESQGDAQGAERIRSSLSECASGEAAVAPLDDPLSAVAEDFAFGTADAEPAVVDAARAPSAGPEAGEGHSERNARIISTLEGWLENIRRDVA